MQGLMMDFQLTLPVMLRRCEQLHGPKKIYTQLPAGDLHEYTYADMVQRTKQLCVALKKLGIQSGDRVATLCWNHYQHLEAYFAIPLCGGVLHTLNLRLHHTDLAYIAGHAGDKIVIVDESLLPLLEQFRSEVNFEHILVICEPGHQPPKGMLDYEEVLADANAADFEYPEFDEEQAAAMCYTSGTTGQPKGVLYSHRAITLHTIGTLTVDGLGVRESDVCLPVVPMFHANAWGLPFSCVFSGASQVFPGPHLQPENLLELLARLEVTLTAGVPTIWLGMLQILDDDPKKYDLSSVRAMVVGGSAAPQAMIEGFQTRHGLNVVHAWGMTEMSPMGTNSQLPQRLLDAPAKEQFAYRATQGRPTPLVEIRGCNENGLIPWDGQAMGELEVRGPWIARSYFESPEGAVSFTDDGWFRTGDIVSIFPDGSMQLQDRAKDVIKSGGEWISSVALENALMGHPAVAEAAVIQCFHPKWHERPLGVAVLKPGHQATAEELKSFIAPNFAKWWLPDDVVMVDEIPRTSAGKFLKSALRERFQDYYTEAAK